MNSLEKLAIVFLTVMVCLGTVSAQQFVIKKRKMAVTIERNNLCPSKISFSGETMKGRQLCVDYPTGVADQLKKFVHTTIKVEAMWTFLSDPNNKAPVAVGMVSMIGSDPVPERTDNATEARNVEASVLTDNQLKRGGRKDAPHK